MKKTVALNLLFFFLAVFVLGTAAFAEEAKQKAEEKKVEEQKKEEAAPPKPETFVEQRVAEVGDKAIDFALLGMKGENLIKFADLSKNSKKVMALVFLNSTCVSCRNEANLLATMKEKYKDDLLLVAIVTDMNPMIYEKTSPESVKNSFTAVHDPEFKLPPAYGFSFTPALVIIKKGKVVETKGGFVPGKDDMAVVKIIKNSM